MNVAIENIAVNDLGNLPINQAIPIRILFCDSTEENYSLFLSNFPIIQIQTNGTSITIEPKRAVTLHIHDPDYVEHGFSQPVFTTIAGIEHRGGSAQVYPKKSFGFELWEDSSGDDKKDAPLLGLRDDDDWILDAMYIDRGKMRNRVSTDLWLEMSSPHYQDQELKAKLGTHGKFVDVFLDNQYHGLYTLTEQMDRKLLQLKESDDGATKGLMYKAKFWAEKIVKFENYFPADPSSPTWDGWEQKYPDPDEVIHWEPLDELVNLVVNSTDSIFKAQISKQIELSSAIDYFILLNILKGEDNTGKNIYLCRYQGNGKLFFVPWDMDATWGRDFIGSETSANTILSNGLFDRLLALNPNDFRSRLKQRWFSLRSKPLSRYRLKSHFENYGELFTNNGAYQRDKDRWDRNDILINEVDYIKNWIDARLMVLDDFYLSL